MHKVCAINIRPEDKESIPYLHDIIKKLEDLKVNILLPEYNILIDSGFKNYITSHEKYISMPDLAISIGGDGTFLYTIRLFKKSIPVFGINKGRVGFLTEFMPDEAINRIGDIIMQNYEISERNMLDAALIRQNKEISTFTFLNDAYISRGSHRPIRLSLETDGRLLNSFSGDGLIISTSTGSTAYSLSAGGPIINPDINNIFLVMPVCPHSLAIRPLIIPASSELIISIISGHEKTTMTIDGHESVNLFHADRIIITGSEKKAAIVTGPEMNFYDILKRKFNWGT